MYDILHQMLNKGGVTMYDILHQMLNMTASASILIAVICVYRLLFKKAPKWITCLLWSVAGLRLVLPFTWQSAVGLLPNRNVITYGGTVNTGIGAVDSAAAAVQGNVIAPAVSAVAQTVGTTSRHLMTALLFGVWVAGIAAMVVFAVVSYLSVYKQVKISVKENGVYLCDAITTPFILGFIKPKIYVPSAMEANNLAAVVAHEQAHIKRKDHWWKPLGYIILSVYWFNPLVWLGYILLCCDIESACDEKVIQKLTTDEIADYSQALLNCSNPKKSVVVYPLAFGETGVKARIKSALSYKKPALWITLVAVLACIAVAVCFTANHKSREGATNSPSFFNSGALLSGSTDSDAILQAVTETYLNGDRLGECDTAAYVILGTEETKTEKIFYTLISYESFGFCNGYFMAESGGTNPAVITVNTASGEWTLSRPRDGSYYGDDIRTLFPAEVRERALDYTAEDCQSLWEQEQKQALAYLNSIGRYTDVVNYGDIEHIFLTDCGISAEVDNAILGLCLPFHNEIGNYEAVEDGVRYVYQTDYNSKTDRVEFTKYEYGTEKAVQFIAVDGTTGKVIEGTSLPTEAPEPTMAQRADGTAVATTAIRIAE